ncbi:MAG: hypothetical protein JSV36_10930, partial [Anaerolineae bacterium]
MATTRGPVTTISRQEWRWAAARAAAVVLAAALPYLIAWWTTPDGLFYTGFLTNPEDGHSYLAKMLQGYRGQWLSHLPYTADLHQGEFLFTWYLALGHVARWMGLPPILVFHGARVVNGFILLMALYAAVAHVMSDLSQRRIAFTLITLGSGFGWLAVLLRGMTIDLWVPEGYVFYSLFVNPHFPLAITLMLFILLCSVTPWGLRRVRDQRHWTWRLLGVALSAAALGLVLPLGLFIVGAALGCYSAILWIQRRHPPWREIISGGAIAVAGGPFVANAYLASTRNPAFAAWSALNQTSSPPPWDYALGYGLILLLALGGLYTALRRRRDSDWLIVAWTMSTAVLLYLPFSLQRRLVMGWIVPLGLLATMGWTRLSARVSGGVATRALARGQILGQASHRQYLRTPLIGALVGITHLFVLVIALVGALTRHPVLYLGADERAGLVWLAENAAPDALVLAGPETSLYIPAWSGQRVWYGHRFETVDAGRRQA